MSKKLNVNQQTILELCGNNHTFFLIPDYQRPYEWGIEECQQLWDDLYGFAIPNDNHENFDKDDEYFLGPIVMFKNNERAGKYEIIDGQQRLTTLMLLLRAFYSNIETLKDAESIKVKENIAKCIWKTDEFDKPDKNILKIDSEVATENDKEEFFSILKDGIVTEKMKSKYAFTYKFFQEKIEDTREKALYIPYLPNRILRNCIILPIEAESQDTALRIFSTLNDRGKPLSDTDIFKAKLYKYFSNKGKKNEFMKRWKHIENIAKEIFAVTYGAPMDELFTRYMYYKRAVQNISNTTVEGLRKFYEKNNYELLCQEETFDNIELLAEFWLKIYRQDDSFSKRVLQKLFVLQYAPNSMWTYLVTVYFFKYKNKNNELNEIEFYNFLDKIIAFIFGYSLIKPGVSALKIPIFTELVNIINNIPIEFKKHKINKELIIQLFNDYDTFTNNRPITKSILAWWAFYQKNQKIFNLDKSFHIEHIYAKKRYEIDKDLQNKENIELIGNKILLENHVNIRAADYRFKDKKIYYRGYTTNDGVQKEGTGIEEFQTLMAKEDFNEKDIVDRTVEIRDSFINYLEKIDLIEN